MTYICNVCEHEILNHEEYVENELGHMAHIDCITGMYDLLKWMGREIKIMDGDMYDE